MKNLAEPPTGLEPVTSSLPRKYSTSELRWLNFYTPNPGGVYPAAKREWPLEFYLNKLI